MENYIVINKEYYAPIEMEDNHEIKCENECDLYDKCDGRTSICSDIEDLTNLHNILFKKLKIHN